MFTKDWIQFTDIDQAIKIDIKTIKWVKNSGSVMLSIETDIKIRKGQEWGAFWKIKDF